MNGGMKTPAERYRMASKTQDIQCLPSLLQHVG